MDAAATSAVSLPVQGALQRVWRCLRRTEHSEVLAEQAALMQRSFPVTLWASLVTSLGTV